MLASEEKARREALDQALRLATPNENADVTVKRAAVFYKFLVEEAG